LPDNGGQEAIAALGEFLVYLTVKVVHNNLAKSPKTTFCSELKKEGTIFNGMLKIVPSGYHVL
jgi:hypothetical protein